jgi:hypothetical protein
LGGLGSLGGRLPRPVVVVVLPSDRWVLAAWSRVEEVVAWAGDREWSAGWPLLVAVMAWAPVPRG